MPPEIKPNQTYISKDGQQLGPFDNTFILNSLSKRTFNYKKGLEGLLFRLGSLELSTAVTADDEVFFRGIVNADKVRDLISDIQVGMA
jgi:hypothetical protein